MSAEKISTYAAINIAQAMAKRLPATIEHPSRKTSVVNTCELYTSRKLLFQLTESFFNKVKDPDYHTFSIPMLKLFS